jgi:hypothetical protein
MVRPLSTQPVKTRTPCNLSNRLDPPRSNAHLDMSFEALARRAPLSLSSPASPSGRPPVAIWPNIPIPNGTYGLFSSSGGGAVSGGRATTETQQQVWQYPWSNDVFLKSDSHPQDSLQQKQTLPIMSHSPTLSSLSPARLNFSHSRHLHTVTSRAHSCDTLRPATPRHVKRTIVISPGAGLRSQAGGAYTPAAKRLGSPVHPCIHRRSEGSCTGRESRSLP